MARRTQQKVLAAIKAEKLKPVEVVLEVPVASGAMPTHYVKNPAASKKRNKRKKGKK